MRDTRSTEIKKILKKQFPHAICKVRIHKYSMGESIYVNTSLVQRERIEDKGSYTGYSWRITEEGKRNREAIRSILKEYEQVDRDQWGEILSGGNTFLFIEEL